MKVLNDMKTLENKLIIYDSNCKVCTSFRNAILKVTSIPDSKIVAYKDLPVDLNQRVDPDKFKNEMALLDTTDGQTIYGAEGVAYIFSTQSRLINFLLQFKPVFHLFNFFYRVQANNRYIIATPKSKFKCDCLPDKIVRYRVSYIAMTVFLSVLLTMLFGISLAGLFSNLTAGEAAMQMLLMAGTGWVLQIILAITVLKEKALDYIGHLGSVMVAGLLILIPSMLLSFLGVQTILIPAISVLVSSSYMLYLHIGRIKYLELSQGWSISWFLFLQATASFWVYFFHLNKLL